MASSIGKISLKDEKAIVVGPWGGFGGDSWDDGSYDGVTEIKLTYGRWINQIQVTYSKDGAQKPCLTHGSTSGPNTATIILEFPEEFLTSVTGYYHLLPDLVKPTPIIRSLKFKSNKNIFGPYGKEEGTPFSLPIEEGKIVGFKGRSGWYLDAIACHISAA